MPAIPETARAYLDAFEVERQAALALSKEKADEAKLIGARQEGFRAALEMLVGEFAGESSGSNPHGHGSVRRRGRRPIRELILRELSFSAEPMTTAQIATAIDYIPERTEKALERMEEARQVLRNKDGWIIDN